MNISFLLRRNLGGLRGLGGLGGLRGLPIFKSIPNRSYSIKREGKTKSSSLYDEINIHQSKGQGQGQGQSLSHLNTSNSKQDKNDEYDKSVFCFYLLINCPMYVISFQLGYAISNHEFLVDLARLYIKSIPFLHFITAGLNFSTVLKDFELKLSEKIRNNQIELDETQANFEIKKIEKFLFLNTLPSFLSFFSSQYILSTSVLTSKAILISFSAFGFVGLLNLVIMYFTLGGYNNNLKMNLFFYLINILTLLIVYNFVKKNKNLERVDDFNRVEHLPNLLKMIYEDNKLLEEEINDLYNDISIQSIIKIQDMFENEKIE
jgi:hypothetical protein